MSTQCDAFHGFTVEVVELKVRDGAAPALKNTRAFVMPGRRFRFFPVLNHFRDRLADIENRNWSAGAVGEGDCGVDSQHMIDCG